MKYLFFTLPFLIIACAAVQHSQIAPVQISSINDPVEKSKDLIIRANQDAKEIYDKGTEPKSEISNEIVQDTSVSIQLHQQALDKIVELQKESDKQSREVEKVVDRLNYLELKYAQSVKILWKWRFISLGGLVGGLVIGAISGAVLMAIFRLWLQANLPIIGKFIP